jgi:hypothetical protein
VTRFVPFKHKGCPRRDNKGQYLHVTRNDRHRFRCSGIATSTRGYLWNIPCLCMPSYVGPIQDRPECDARTFIWSTRLQLGLHCLLDLFGRPVDIRRGALHPGGIQRLDIRLGTVRHDPRRVDLRVGVVVVLLDIYMCVSKSGQINPQSPSGQPSRLSAPRTILSTWPRRITLIPYPVPSQNQCDPLW